jgi:hypothetical protein
MATTLVRKDSISAALSVVRAHFKTHDALATQLGISNKTLERYVYGRGKPKPARRPGMLRALVGSIDLGLLARLARVMEVPEHQLPEPLRVHTGVDAPPRLQGVALEASLEMALFGAAERHGVTSVGARHVAMDVLRHVIMLGVPVTAAHSALAAADAKRAGA